MNAFTLLLLISISAILLIALDVARRQHIKRLHIALFLAIVACITSLILFPNLLISLGSLLGIPRGADAIVYGSILFLLYISIVFYSKIEKTSEDLTLLIRGLALASNSKSSEFSNNDTVFVIPAYNEAKVIKATLQKLIDSGFRRIVLVNDGSMDDTAKIAGEFSKSHGVVVLSHIKNRGQGAALETGFEYIRRSQTLPKFIATFDSDGQHDPHDIIKMKNFLEGNSSVDIALGSRFIGKTNSNVPALRKILLKLAVIFTMITSGVKLTDAHNGLRLMRRSVLDKIKLHQDGMAHASEIIEGIAKQKVRYAEIPVNITYSEYSTAKGQRGLNAVNIAIRIISHKLFR